MRQGTSSKWGRVMRQGMSISIRASAGLVVKRPALDRISDRVMKRLVNIISSLIGLLLSFPITAILSLIVYVKSPSSVFYRQRRLSKSGKPFDIVKMRNMPLDSAKDRQIEWTIPDHSCRLKIGAFMREWNIDKVPQFWDVLKGKRGLVGSRPEHLQRNTTFNRGILHYNACHRKPNQELPTGLRSTVCVATLIYANARMLDRESSQRRAKFIITCENFGYRPGTTSPFNLFIRRAFFEIFSRVQVPKQALRLLSRSQRSIATQFGTIGSWQLQPQLH